MTETRFSRVQGLEQPPALLPYDAMPGLVREEIYNLLRLYPGSNNFYQHLGQKLRFFQRIYGHADGSMPSEVHANALFILLNADWNHVFDLCQEIREIIIDRFSTSEVKGWDSGLKNVFDEVGLAWRAVGSGFERVMDEAIAGSIQAAKNVLRAPRFEGPNEQFTLAINFFSERPEPNLKDCINNAAGAVEAVAKIIAGKPDMPLSTLLRREPLKSAIHQTLLDALDKIYAYRGAVTAHGQTGSQSEYYRTEEAELVLGMCATWMVYLSNKFPSEA